MDRAVQPRALVVDSHHEYVAEDCPMEGASTLDDHEMQSEGTFTYPDPEEANKTLRSPYPVLSDEQPTLYSGPRMKGRWSPLREGMKSSKEALDPKTGSKRSADFMSFGEKMSQDASFGRILMSQYITQIKEPRLAADVHGCGEDSKGRETTPDSPVSQATPSQRRATEHDCRNQELRPKPRPSGASGHFLQYHTLPDNQGRERCRR
ncbi:hypothetical protein M8818_001504 [Zalaria obscura]|uniref:Uncharacterized protein n=1 Tax=Zalaria obscura TaxID=2024903 RepID=A0ACC3SJX9_9PEZI